MLRQFEGVVIPGNPFPQGFPCKLTDTVAPDGIAFLNILLHLRAILDHVLYLLLSKCQCLLRGMSLRFRERSLLGGDRFRRSLLGYDGSRRIPCRHQVMSDAPPDLPYEEAYAENSKQYINYRKSFHRFFSTVREGNRDP